RIVITFSRPMVPLTTLDEEKIAPGLVEITPPLSGEFRWLGTSALVFIPTDRFNYATKYQVKVSGKLSDVQGGILGEDYTWEFTSPSPRLEKTDLWLGKDKEGNDEIVDLADYPFLFGKTPLRLHFNQDVEIGKNQSLITLQAAKVEKDQKVQYDQTMNFKLEYGFLDGNIQKNILQLVPDLNWETWQAYRLELKPPFHSLEGDLLDPDQKDPLALQFKSAPAFKIVSIEPQGEQKNDNQGNNSTGVKIRFSVPISADSLAKNLSLSPEYKVFPEGSEVFLEEQGTFYQAWWDLKPSTVYKIKISQNLQDRWGRNLAEDFEQEFKTSALSANFFLETKGKDFGVFESGLAPIYRLHYVNLPELNISLAKISLSELLQIQSQKKKDYEWQFHPQAKQVIKKWQIKPNAKLNEQVSENLDLSQYLPAKNLESGIYFIELSSPVLKDYEGKIVYQQQFFYITPYVLTLKYNKEQILVVANSLRDMLPVEGLKWQAWSLDGKSQLKGVTDAQGMSKIDFNLSKVVQEGDWENEFIIQGEKDGKNTWLGSNWNDGVEPWKFGIWEKYLNTQQNLPELFGQIITDRPLYKPGEKVYFKGLMRVWDTRELKYPSENKIILKVRDADWHEFLTQEYKLSTTGSFDGSFDLPNTGTYGNFQIEATLMRGQKTDEDWNSRIFANFWMTHFEKSPFKVSIESVQKDYLWGEDLKFKVKAETFYGAPLAKQKLRLDLDSTDYYFNRLENEWYSFAPLDTWCWGECNRNNHHLGDLEVNLNEKGEYEGVLPIKTKNAEEIKLSQVLVLSAQVSDENSSQTVSNSQEFMAHLANFYLGVKTEENLVKAGDDLNFKVISVDELANPIPQQKFQALLLERTYKSIKRQNVDGGFYYENESVDQEISKQDLMTDAEGKIQAKFNIPKSGGYVIRVSAQTANNQKINAETEFWASGNERISWPYNNHDRIDLVLDKKEYQI
ncbi:MAG TPA: MG2 domain-containing protein, partial [Candidatus Gracilibacteria bacterium]|nr:MG2 domain-containing protein [Candidatus Gracilibacteria bacterium]